MLILPTYLVHFIGMDAKSQANIGSDNGLVPPGTKPLSDTLLTEISVAILHCQATLTLIAATHVESVNYNTRSSVKLQQLLKDERVPR